jgi:bifunctional non-homologous end joining protein LigD
VGGELFFQKRRMLGDARVRQFDAALDPQHAPLLEVATMQGLLSVACGTWWSSTQNALASAYDTPNRLVADHPGQGRGLARHPRGGRAAARLPAELGLPAR